MNKYKLILIGISLIAIFLNNLSFIMGMAGSSLDFVFLGRHFINSQDLYTYVSFVEQAKQGRILFENLYMSEPQHASLLRPSYLLIGKAAWILHLSSITAYHLARIILTFGFFLSLYKFLGLFFKRDQDRVVPYALVLLSSGVGFVATLFAPLSSDLWIPESITFLSLGEAPHFILSQILMLWGFWFYLKAFEEGRYKNFFIATFLFFLLTFEHPFNIIIIAGVIIISSIWIRVRSLSSQRQITMGLAISLPFLALGLIYQFVEIRQNPILQRWAAQNLLISPHPINYIYGYGLLILLAILGAEKYLRYLTRERILLLSWIASSLILLYAPIFFQRRFVEGLHIPISILASIGLLTFTSYCTRFVKETAKKVVGIGIICLSIFILSLSNIIGVFGDIAIISQDSPQNYYYHILKSEINALYFLRDNSNNQDVILSNKFYGNIIPGIIGRNVFIGHGVQTPYQNKKIEQVNAFLLNKDAKQARNFLLNNHITYIFLGRNDSMISYGFKPDEKTYLTKIYDEDGVMIYKVK